MLVLDHGDSVDHDRVQMRGGELNVTADPTGNTETFVAVTTDNATVADDIGSVLEELVAGNRAAEIDPLGISYHLTHILRVTPTTVFKGISELVYGQVLHAQPGDPASVAIDGAFPYLAGRSRQDERPDARRLLDLIVAATARSLESATSGFLTLSAGKDSTSLALALAEMGRRDIPCVTFSRGASDPETAPARDLCRRLGLDHVVFELPRSGIEETLVRFFEASPVPSADLALVPYAVMIMQLGRPGGAVLDGSGNDPYMGFVAGRDTRLKLRYRVRGRTVADALTRVLPIDSPTNYLLRSRAAASYAGRTMRNAELARIYPPAVDTHRLVYDLSRRHRGLSTGDFLAATNGRFASPTMPMLKLRLAARAAGMSPAMPFCDRDLIDYYFNLPESDRFDEASGRNKVLLRRMLTEFAGYDADAVGKYPFIFDGAGFLTEHRSFVFDEIASCSLWSNEAPSIAARWLDALPIRPFLHHALLGWFQVSAWHNHSRYLQTAR